MAYEPDLTHAEARAIVDRALTKAGELKQAGAFAVTDAGGNLICLSRMGEAPASAAWEARGTAYLSATHGAASGEIGRVWSQSPTPPGQRADDIMSSPP